MDPAVERDDRCFCCGSGNERGLKLSIAYPSAGTAESSFVVPAWFTGWRDMTHGGLLATVLDEIMAHACIGVARRAVTAEITVRYQAPVRVGSPLRAVGKVEETRGRILLTRGWLHAADGSVVAEAHARFLAPGRPAGPPPDSPAAPAT